jgi:hypothetical protein
MTVEASVPATSMTTVGTPPYSASAAETSSGSGSEVSMA